MVARKKRKKHAEKERIIGSPEISESTVSALDPFNPKQTIEEQSLIIVDDEIKSHNKDDDWITITSRKWKVGKKSETFASDARLNCTDEI